MKNYKQASHIPTERTIGRVGGMWLGSDYFVIFKNMIGFRYDKQILQKIY